MSQRQELIPEVIPRQKGHINIGSESMIYRLMVTWKLRKLQANKNLDKVLLLNLEQEQATFSLNTHPAMYVETHLQHPFPCGSKICSWNLRAVKQLQLRPVHTDCGPHTQHWTSLYQIPRINFCRFCDKHVAVSLHPPPQRFTSSIRCNTSNWKSDED